MRAAGAELTGVHVSHVQVPGVMLAGLEDVQTSNDTCASYEIIKCHVCNLLKNIF